MSRSFPTTNPEPVRRIASWGVPALALGLGLFVRCLHLLDFQTIPLFDFPTMPDVSEYWNEARAIAYGAPRMQEVSIHGPLYPWLLAGLIRICDGSVFAIRFLQSAIALAAAIPFFLTLRDAFSARRTALRFVPETFLFFFALWPPLVAFQTEFFSENAALLALSGAVWFFGGLPRCSSQGRRAASAVGVGLCCGLAALAHPSALLFPLLCAGALLFRRQGLLFVLLLSSLALTIAPSAIRNARIEHRFVPIQKNSMFNLWLGNSPDATGLCRIPPGDEWQDVHARPESERMEPDAWFLRESLRFFRETPFDAMRNLVRKAALAFHTEELTTWSDASPLGLLFLHRNGFGFFAVPGCLALAGLGLIASSRALRRDAMPFLILLVAGWAAQTFFVAAGRYRIPMLPAVFALDAILLCALPFLLRRRRRVLRLALWLALAAAFTFSTSPARDVRLERDYALTCLADAYALSGDKRKAEEILTPLSATWMRDARVVRMLGGLLLDRGDVAGARKAAERAMELSPGKPDPMILAGRVLAAQKAFPAAQAAYRDALAVADGSSRAAACFYLGELFRMRGDPESARSCYESALSLDPTMSEAWNNLGVLHADDPKTALRFFETACRFAPTEDHLWNRDLMRDVLAGREPPLPESQNQRNGNADSDEQLPVSHGGEN